MGGSTSIPILSGPGSSMGGPVSGVINGIIVPKLTNSKTSNLSRIVQRHIAYTTGQRVNSKESLCKYLDELESKCSDMHIGLLYPSELQNKTDGGILHMEHVFQPNEVAVFAVPFEQTPLFYSVDLSVSTTSSKRRDLLTSLKSVPMSKIQHSIRNSTVPVVLNYIGSKYPKVDGGDIFYENDDKPLSDVEILIGYKLFCIDMRELFSHPVTVRVYMASSHIGSSIISGSLPTTDKKKSIVDVTKMLSHVFQC